MLNKMYVVFDRVKNECTPIFFAKNDGVAIRDFKNALAADSANDYKLLYLGNFDTESMKFDALSTPAEVEIL